MDEGRSIIISKTLSRVLRHNPALSVEIDDTGYARLADVVAYMKTVRPFSETGLDVVEVLDTVKGDAKQRFQIDGDTIRALSGHSFPVDTGGEPFDPDGPLYFGTTQASRRVLDEGLLNSKKLKVRLSYSHQEAFGIASSRPAGDPLVIEVDAVRLAQDGWSFELLSNGEILTNPIGPEYLSEARDPKVLPLRRP